MGKKQTKGEKISYIVKSIMKNIFKTTILITIIALTACTVYAQSVRLKDIAYIEGVRGNQLMGYGLVIGLEGTGDSQQTKFTTQSIANMLDKFGISIAADKLKIKNVAAVMISANLPAFARPGSTIDIVVSSIGDCSSLKGGILLQSPLKAANGEVYAVAQGSVSVGGFSAGGGGGGVTKNHPTVGRIPGGAIIEKETKTDIANKGIININLSQNDFTTASRVADAINKKIGDAVAIALDGNVIKVKVPDFNSTNLIAYIADLENVELITDTVAKVIVNERTGTVVIGGKVKLSAVAISHGSLTVEINNELQVSQPNALAGGKTAVVPKTETKVTEDKSTLVQLKETATIEDLTKALNALKVTPRDLIAILQAIKEAGALQAQLEVI